MSKGFRHTFRAELMVAFTCIGVIPFVLCCVILIQGFRFQTDMDDSQRGDQVVADVTGSLNNMLEELEMLSERIAGNVKLSQALAMENEDEYLEMIYQELYAKTSQCREYAEFELYDLNGYCKFSTDSGLSTQKVSTYWGVLKKALLNPYSMVSAKGGLTADDGDTVLTFARMIIPYDKANGFFVMRISKSKFQSIVQGTYGAQDGFVLMDSFLNSIYEAGSAENISVDRTIRGRYLEGNAITDNIGNNIVLFSKLSEADCYVAVMTPRSFSDDTTHTLYRLLIAMAVMILIVSVLISNMFSKRLSKPITVMRENMREVRTGNLSVRMETNWKNEFSDLANSFNHMTSELKEYMNLQVEQQKELNGTQIAMMQAQLNPHFLYNTLDTMKWVAKANHVPELVTLVSKLSKILRASISKEQFVTLKSEMELVESYAEIQRIRFGGRFECSVEYSPEIEDVMVPKLVVQPIVENAVIHGLENAEDGHILVEAYIDHAPDRIKDILVIEVTDDGRGITDEEIEKLKAPDPDEKKGHIGIKNVARIIELNYGSDYGLKINRGKEKGTIVTMTFPVEGRMETDLL